MNNNRKQKITSVLDSLTRKEIEDYLKGKKYIDSQILKCLDKIKVNREESHLNTILRNINMDSSKIFESYFKLGAARIVAFVLECFYDKKYKIADLKEYFKAIIDNDKELKEYVYDLMKDF